MMCCRLQNQLKNDKDWRQYPMVVSRLGKRKDDIAEEDFDHQVHQIGRPKRRELMGYGPMIPRRNYRDWMTRLG